MCVHVCEHVCECVCVSAMCMYVSVCEHVWECVCTCLYISAHLEGQDYKVERTTPKGGRKRITDHVTQRQRGKLSGQGEEPGRVNREEPRGEENEYEPRMRTRMHEDAMMKPIALCAELRY